MKNVFLMFVILCPCFILAQQTADFRSKNFVKFKNGRYEAWSYNTPLKIVTHNPSPTSTLKYTGTVNGQAISISEPGVNDVLTLTDVTTQYAGNKRFKGDIRQSHDTLYFYPWPFKKPDTDAKIKRSRCKYTNECNRVYY